MASVVSAWVEVFSFICPLLAGSPLRVVCTLQRKMASAPVFAISLFLVLTVHGSEVVARVRFTDSHFMVKENPQICLDLVNELYDPDAVTTQNIIITAQIDKTLLGINSPGSFDTSIQIFPNSSIAKLCFPHPDNNVPCEAPITGAVSLLSSPVVAIGSPSTAQVTITDDDATEASFEEETYFYSESGMFISGTTTLPTVKVCKIRSTIQLNVSEKNHISTFAQASLNFPGTILTVNNTSQTILLPFTDDNIALEQTEVVSLELRSIPDPESTCNQVHITTPNVTTIFIEDDDTAMLSIQGSDVRVRESERYAQVCVSLSHIIARNIEFELWTHSGTAQSGVDFSASKVAGHFEAMSNDLVHCYNVPVFVDDLVEREETFNVSLHLKTNLSPSLSQRLVISQNQVRITIIDTSSCVEHIELSELKTEKENYISQLKTVCFTCSAFQSSSPNSATNGLFWTFGDIKLSKNESNAKGRVFQNGTLMIINTSQTFNTENATRLSCVNNSQSVESQNALIFLGAPPSSVSLSYKNGDTMESMTLTCSYRGSPQPRLEWLRNSVPLPERGNDSITVHKSQSSFESLLTVPIQTGVMKYSYSCVVSNQFGNANSSIVITVSVSGTNESQASHNSAFSSLRDNLAQRSVILIVLLHLLLFVHLLS